MPTKRTRTNANAPRTHRGASTPRPGAGQSRRVRSSQPSSPSVGSAVGGALAGIGSVVGGAADKVKERATPKQGGFSTSYQQTGGTSPFTSGSRSTRPSTRRPDDGKGVILTRRNLLIGAGAVGGVAVVGGVGAFALDKVEGSKSNTVDYISVAESAVTGISDLTETDFDSHCSLVGSYKLPYGTLVWADNSTLAACLVPGDTSDPLNIIELLTLSSGNTTKAVTNAEGASEGYQIMDARCSEKGLVWTEVNVFANSWRIYTATISGSSIGSATLVDQGDSNWVSPSIAAVGNRAFWQRCPNSDGTSGSDPSKLRSVEFGKTDVTDILSSKRAFACRVQPASGGVVCAPRADVTGTYYTLTYVNENCEIVDELTLPSSMKPCQIGYGRSGFSFAFTGTYSYGGGIANLGTYTPMREAQPYDYNNLSHWFRFGRTPSASPFWCGEWFCVKSTRAISCIHFASKSYFSITPPSGVQNWGEYLASSGTGTYIVGLSQINDVGATSSSSSSDYAYVRVFKTNASDLGGAFS